MISIGTSAERAAAPQGSPQSLGGHLPALDGLRGVAVAAVLVFHAGFLDGGYLGVDLFFVLSGFLITGLLVTETARSGTVRLGTFWARRARRLLPALFALLLVVGMWGLRARSAPSDGSLGKELLAALGYYSNWEQLFGGGGYWAEFSSPRVLEHLWSLAIEEQFYMVWPLVLWGCARLAGNHRRGGRRFRRSLLVVILVGIVASIVASQWLYSTRGPERVYLGTDTRIVAILFGAALAVITRGGRSVNSAKVTRIIDTVGVIAAFGLGVAWVNLAGTSNTLYRGGLIACSFAGALVIAAAALSPGGLITRAFSFAPLRALGTISYGLYLWHWPIFVWMGVRASGFADGSRAILAIAVSLAVAIGSYFLIEAPIRYQRFNARIVGASGLAALVACSTLVVLNINQAGPTASTQTRALSLPTQIDSTSTTSAARTTSPPGISSSSVAGIGTVTSSSSVPPSRPLRVLLLGDSVALTLSGTWESIAPEAGIQLGTDSEVGCNFFVATRHRALSGDLKTKPPAKPCQTRLQNDLDRFDPDVVFLATLTNTREEFEVDGQWMAVCTDRYEAALTVELETILRVADSHGTRLLLGTTVPMAAFWLGTADANVKHLEWVDCHNEVLRSFAKDHSATVAIADVYEWTCPNDECIEYMDGVKLQPDGAHFEGEGAAKLFEWMKPRLFENARPITP